MKIRAIGLVLLGLAALASVAAAAFLLATRGGSMPATVSERSYGTGADEVWLFRPPGKVRAAVLFVHGLGDQRETTPYYHRPWLDHLAGEGYAVIYPRYEAKPFAPNGLQHLVAGARRGWRELGASVPVVAIGYSRGGRLVVDYASVAHGVQPVPRAILSVFPAGQMDTLLNLHSIAAGTKIVMLAGDKDTTVGMTGVNQLVTQLAASGFPYADLSMHAVRSHGAFQATHLSVLEDSPGARAAYWAPADTLIASVASR